jgi:hypothetical protein
VSTPLSRLFPLRRSLRRDLVLGTIDSAAYCVMMGCGEMYLGAFVLALGLGPLVAGLTASVPLLIGAVLQLAAPLAVRRVGGRRQWVILCVIVQAVSFLPLAWWSFRGRAEAWQILAAASVYWSAGMAASPAWTSWMAALVPVRVRTVYFAGRNRLGQVAVLASFVAGGLLLRAEAARDAALQGFAVLFLTAAVARLFSAVCFWPSRDPGGGWQGGVAPPAQPIRERIRAGIREVTSGPGGPVVAFLCCFTFGVQFAGPYFTPYMLEALGFSYGQFLVVFAAGFLIKAVVLPSVGRLGARIGSRQLLAMASLAIVPVALLWLPSSEVWWLVIVQLVAGTCWAAYELSVALLLFEVAGDRDHSGVVSVYTLGLAVATVAGATAGGLVIRSLGEGREAYAAVFAGSCLLRAMALPLLGRLRQHARADATTRSAGG